MIYQSLSSDRLLTFSCHHEFSRLFELFTKLLFRLTLSLQLLDRLIMPFLSIFIIAFESKTLELFQFIHFAEC
jgi:hypothetical protein